MLEEGIMVPLTGKLEMGVVGGVHPISELQLGGSYEKPSRISIGRFSQHLHSASLWMLDSWDDCQDGVNV